MDDPRDLDRPPASPRPRSAPGASRVAALLPPGRLPREPGAIRLEWEGRVFAVEQVELAPGAWGIVVSVELEGEPPLEVQRQLRLLLALAPDAVDILDLGP